MECSGWWEEWDAGKGEVREGTCRRREDRKKHRFGKEKNALKLLCWLSCCFLLLADGV